MATRRAPQAWRGRTPLRWLLNELAYLAVASAGGVAFLICVGFLTAVALDAGR